MKVIMCGGGTSGHVNPALNIAAVTTKVRKRVAELTNNTHFPLQVFILTGIAGGTGSGAVIDLTYLIRNTVESMPGNLDNPGCFVPARSQYCGFILLPPTGVSTDPLYIDRGNRNGYAAMKEINYFMGIRERGDSYEMTYGNGQRVCSRKNIFDECWLVGDTGGIVFSDPREVAINDLAATLLNRVAHTGMSSDRIKPYSELPALNWVRDARMSYEYALRSSSSAGLHLSETQQGDWRDFPDLLTRDK